MSEEQLPFEEKWRETLNSHQPQVEAGDWAGMEILLQQQAAAARDRQRIMEDPLDPHRPVIGPPPNSPPIGWIILSLLAVALLFYLLGLTTGRDTVGDLLPPGEESRPESPLAAVVDSLPERDTLIQLAPTAPVAEAATLSTLPHRKTVRYDTVFLTDQGGKLGIAVDTVTTISVFPQVDTPAMIRPVAPQRYRLDVRPLPPLLPLLLPGDRELLEGRMDALRSSGRLKIIAPTNNGYYPEYPRF